MSFNCLTEFLSSCARATIFHVVSQFVCCASIDQQLFCFRSSRQSIEVHFPSFAKKTSDDNRHQRLPAVCNTYLFSCCLWKLMYYTITMKLVVHCCSCTVSLFKGEPLSCTCALMIATFLFSECFSSKVSFRCFCNFGFPIVRNEYSFSVKAYIPNYREEQKYWFDYSIMILPYEGISWNGKNRCCLLEARAILDDDKICSDVVR
jgi:hypothetical protein